MLNKNLTPVFVVWKDASGISDAWTPLREVEKFNHTIVSSVGFVIKENKDFLVIASSMCEDSFVFDHDTVVRQLLFIPKEMVVSKKMLKIR